METCDVFLGGHDLEVVEIRNLVAQREDVKVHDAGLAWGAKASSYAAELRDALNASHQVVLVELIDDLPADFPRDRILFVDHHNAVAGEDRPTSIEQVFGLLNFPREHWTRDMELVAANDRGHVAALRRAGATAEEIKDVRVRDRRAQGITEDEERVGLEAARRASPYFGGRLTLVRLPHNRSATVTDALDAALGGPGFQDLLVLSPDQTLFFGEGRCIETLRRLYLEGWYGGELPARGYWGIARALPERPLLDALEVSIVTRRADEIVVNAFHHILLWPLLMRGPSGREQSIDSHVGALKTAGWCETATAAGRSGSVDADYTYEEIVYFHPFVRDFLFGDGRAVQEDRPLRRFNRTDLTEVKIAIDPGGDSRTKPFDTTLRVERAEIFLIRPRVLILLVEVSNRTPAAGDGTQPQQFPAP
jgi:hypothetical protein